MAPRNRYQRFLLRDICQHCERSKKGTYEGDGRLYCSRCGHHLEQYLPTVDDEINPFGLEVADHVATTNDDEDSSTLTKAQKRQRAKRAYLMLYQYLLKQHCLFLIHTKNVPREIEVVVRDLWALWQSHYPYGDFQEEDPDTGADSQVETGSIAGGSTTGRNSRESSVFSTSGISSLASSDNSDSELSDRTTITGARRYRTRNGTDLSRRPHLIDTLSLCYMACRLLRLPIRLGDFHRWAEQGHLWHNSLLATLSKEHIQYLDNSHMSSINTAPSLPINRFFRQSVSFDIAFRRKFKISIPVLNWPLLGYRYILDILLPIEIYPMITTISQTLQMNFFLHSDRLSGKRMRMADIPDVQLIATIVVATKFLFPADGIRRYRSLGTVASEENDASKDIDGVNDGDDTAIPAILPHPAQPAPSFDWKVWLHAIGQREGRILADRSFRTHDADKLSDGYIWNKMTVTEMDRYMSWFEDTFIRRGGDASDVLQDGIGIQQQQQQRQGGNAGGNSVAGGPLEQHQRDSRSSSRRSDDTTTTTTANKGEFDMFERLFDAKLQLDPHPHPPPSSSSLNGGRDQSQGRNRSSTTTTPGNLEDQEFDTVNGTFGSVDRVDESEEMHSQHGSGSNEDTSTPGAGPTAKQPQTQKQKQKQKTAPLSAQKDTPPLLLLGQKYKIFRTVQDLSPDPNPNPNPNPNSSSGTIDTNPDPDVNVNGAEDETESNPNPSSLSIELQSYQELYRQASIYSGVPLSQLVPAVYSIDRRLSIIMDRRRKKLKIPQLDGLSKNSEDESDDEDHDDDDADESDGKGEREICGLYGL